MAQRITQAVRGYIELSEGRTLESAPSLAPSSAERVKPIDFDEGVPGRCAHFQIEAPIGRGGMGLVYRAWDRVLRRAVAVKILPDAAECDAGDRILDEARAQARLSSPHIVHVYYVGRTAHPENEAVETSFFAMELCEGGTLDDLLERNERLGPERASEYLLAVARGLADALAQGIVHRDIKPSNLLLDENGRVRIADFGVARCLDKGGSLTVTRTGRMVGTPLYMAPEQIRGEPTDHRADIYSLGCTFYHLISGRPPFEASTPVRLLQKHLFERAPALTSAAPDAPGALGRIVDKMLEKDPRRRHQSYEELIAALVEAGRPLRRAGVGVRFAAAAVDLLLALGLIVLVGWPGLALHLGLVTAGHALYGQTLGKWLMSIEARASDGGPLGLGRALLRTATSVWLPLLVLLALVATTGLHGLVALAEQLRRQDIAGFTRSLAGLALGHALLSALYAVGLVSALLDPKKRAVHDVLAGSQVWHRS